MSKKEVKDPLWAFFIPIIIGIIFSSIYIVYNLFWYYNGNQAMGTLIAIHTFDTNSPGQIDPLHDYQYVFRYSDESGELRKGYYDIGFKTKFKIGNSVKILYSPNTKSIEIARQKLPWQPVAVFMGISIFINLYFVITYRRDKKVSKNKRSNNHSKK